MELQFDKEIDAILRKAPKGTSVDTAASGHIDADTIAAFAEGALPERAKLHYMSHLADCDSCRKVLSHSMAWPPAEKPPKSVVVAAGAAIPWYSKIFRTPSLAVAMGALVLAFGGVLAFLVISRNSADRNTTVTQVMNSEPAPDVQRSQSAVSNSANSAAAATNTVNDTSDEQSPDAEAKAKEGSPDATAKPAPRGPAESPSSGIVMDGVESSAVTEQPKSAAPPPPPVAEAQPSDERKDADDGETRSRDMKLSKKEDDRMSREAPSRAAPAGPNRNYGPKQNTQNNAQNAQNVQSNTTVDVTAGGRMAASANSPVKTAGGKKFEKRDGAWYDTSYRGQATRDVPRGSEAFKNLDSGLKSIASRIGGVVVIVWKGTAYRIQ